MASLCRSERPSAVVPGVIATPFLKKSSAACEVALLERAHAAQFVRQPTLERQIEFLPERVRHEHLGVLPQLDVLLGFRRVAEPAVRHRPAANARSAGSNRASALFERRDGTREVSTRERCLPQTHEDGRHLRRQLTGALEQRLGLLGLPLDPDSRGPARSAWSRRSGLNLEDSTEGGVRTAAVLPFALVQVRQEVGPPRLLRHERLGIEVGGLRRRVVLARPEGPCRRCRTPGARSSLVASGFLIVSSIDWYRSRTWSCTVASMRDRSGNVTSRIVGADDVEDGWRNASESHEQKAMATPNSQARQLPTSSSGE